MGLKDRLNATKRWLWSPMAVHMVDLGSDKLVRAGETAEVVVDVRGGDDGTPERIEVFLKMRTPAADPGSALSGGGLDRGAYPCGRGDQRRSAHHDPPA